MVIQRNLWIYPLALIKRALRPNYADRIGQFFLGLGILIAGGGIRADSFASGWRFKE